MVILDEKGRLFGKLNIIDLLLVIVLICGLAYGGYKIIGRYFIHTEFEDYKVVLRAEDVNAEMADAIHIGDTLIERSGAVVGTVVEPRPYLMPSEVYVQNREGRIETAIQPKLRDLMITIIVKVPKGQRIKYNTNNLLIGSRLEYEFNTNGTFKTIRYDSVKLVNGNPSAYDSKAGTSCMNLKVIDSVPSVRKYYGLDADKNVWSVALPVAEENKLLEKIASESSTTPTPSTQPQNNPAKPEEISMDTQFKPGDVIEACGKVEDGEGVGGSHMKALCVSIQRVAR